MKTVTKETLNALVSNLTGRLVNYENKVKHEKADTVPGKKRVLVEAARHELENISNAINMHSVAIVGADNESSLPEDDVRVFINNMKTALDNLSVKNVALEAENHITHTSYRQLRLLNKGPIESAILMNWFRSSRVNTAIENNLVQIEAFEKNKQLVITPSFFGSFFKAKPEAIVVVDPNVVKGMTFSG